MVTNVALKFGPAEPMVGPQISEPTGPVGLQGKKPSVKTGYDESREEFEI